MSSNLLLALSSLWLSSLFTDFHFQFYQIFTSSSTFFSLLVLLDFYFQFYQIFTSSCSTRLLLLVLHSDLIAAHKPHCITVLCFDYPLFPTSRLSVRLETTVQKTIAKGVAKGQDKKEQNVGQCCVCILVVSIGNMHVFPPVQCSRN